MGKTQIQNFIQTIFPMAEAQAVAITDFFKEKEFSKTDLLVTKGRTCKEYFFLEDGFVRAYTYDLEGNDITTAFFSPGQFVCELFSFFKRVTSSENFQALTDCKAWFISYEELQHVFHSMPEFREFGRAILINAYAQLKQRMLGMIQDSAEERYAHLLQSNPDIFQHAALKNIATYLGVTDTSLSRIRKEFAKNHNIH
ncbi:MAG: Crp/Fnr family transcriptional regulator [Flavisolibacter sp.]